MYLEHFKLSKAPDDIKASPHISAYLPIPNNKEYVAALSGLMVQ